MNIIYKHTSKTSGKSYIGKTSKTIEKRLDEHTYSVGKGANSHFKNAIQKYGVEDFISEILEIDVEDENASEREIYWISYYDTYNNGYNMTLGGEGASGYKQTDEHKEKRRQANLGLKRTDEQKKNISDAHKGQVPWNKGISYIVDGFETEVECPWCNKVGRVGGMKSNHFDYCRENPDRVFKDKKEMSEETKLKISETSKKLEKFECPYCSRLVGVQGKSSHMKKCIKQYN